MSKQTMNWKQLVSQIPTKNQQSNEISPEIVKLRAQCIKLKGQLIVHQQDSQIITKQNNQLKNLSVALEKKCKKILTAAQLHNQNDIHSLKLTEMFAIIQDKFNQFISILESSRQDSNQASIKNKTNEQRLSSLQNNLNNLSSKAKQYQSQNTVLSNKISQLTKQNRALSSEKNTISIKYQDLQNEYRIIWEQLCDIKNRGSHRQQKECQRQVTQKVKKQCYQLLSYMSVNEDQYLKNYLIKNGKLQRNNHVYNRRDKYDFIFDHD